MFTVKLFQLLCMSEIFHKMLVAEWVGGWEAVTAAVTRNVKLKSFSGTIIISFCIYQGLLILLVLIHSFIYSTSILHQALV